MKIQTLESAFHAGRTASILVTMLALRGCPSSPVAPTHDAQDGALLDDCEAACARMSQFGCFEADASALGESCPALCRRAGSYLDVNCVMHAGSRADLNVCGVRCER